MVSTRDGHNLLVEDECLIVSLKEDNEYIESSTSCVYKGSSVRDNRPLLATLPQGCSGSRIPETQVMHHFVNIHDINEKFDLLEHDVKQIVIKDSSSIEEVVEKKLKGNDMETITILKIKYDELIESQRLLQALESAGVDNWEGYDMACESLDD